MYLVKDDMDISSRSSDPGNVALELSWISSNCLVSCHIADELLVEMRSDRIAVDVVSDLDVQVGEILYPVTLHACPWDNNYHVGWLKRSNGLASEACLACSWCCFE